MVFRLRLSLQGMPRQPLSFINCIREFSVLTINLAAWDVAP